MFLTANIFQPLIDVFEAVLKFFHNSLGVPWGWAIVLLTIVIRALLIPLTVKQFHSMQKLQQLQPQLKALQAKYKDDKQRQQQELMKFYKENQINPLGSCLPLVAQLPVFISLFYMLRSSLRRDICPALQPHTIVNGHTVFSGHTVACGGHGANFLFIHDLTNKATGGTLIALIVLYVGTQLASTLMMSTPTMEKTQRQLMLVMPLFFVIFIISFPAGVIVYWITTNTWTILQQYVVRRRIGPVAPATAGVGPTLPDSGDSGRSGGSGGARAPRGASPKAEAAGNGDGGSQSGLGGMIRARLKQAQDGGDSGAVKTPAARSQSTPPPPPRKKKKRSGRRR